MTAPGGKDRPEKASAPDLRTRLALRPKEAAGALGICDRTLRQWMQEEQLPYFQVGRSIFIPILELERWMANRMESRRDALDLAGEILRNM
ncbi:MAG: helix-turn-helix domain-containing protein [Deltaproteobacteria bacterium]|nr:helix-turn-helix domain-containing protein [Deltaproteobacteria bacterium]